MHRTLHDGRMSECIRVLVKAYMGTEQGTDFPCPVPVDPPVSEMPELLSVCS